MWLLLTTRDGVAKLFNMDSVDLCEPDPKGGTRLLMRGRTVCVLEPIEALKPRLCGTAE